MKALSSLATAYSPAFSCPELQAHQKAPCSPAQVLEVSLLGTFEQPFHPCFSVQILLIFHSPPQWPPFCENCPNSLQGLNVLPLPGWTQKWVPDACMTPQGPVSALAQNSLSANVAVVVSDLNHRNAVQRAFGPRKAYVWTKVEKSTQSLATTKQKNPSRWAKNYWAIRGWGQSKGHGKGRRKIQRRVGWQRAQQQVACCEVRGYQSWIFSIKSLGGGVWADPSRGGPRSSEGLGQSLRWGAVTSQHTFLCCLLKFRQP